VNDLRSATAFSWAWRVLAAIVVFGLAGCGDQGDRDDGKAARSRSPAKSRPPAAAPEPVTVEAQSASPTGASSRAPALLGTVAYHESVARELGIDGYVVGVVSPGSPARRVGLRPGDAIVRAGGARVRNREELKDVTSALSIGDRLNLEVVRDGESQLVAVALAARIQPADDASQRESLRFLEEIATRRPGPGVSREIVHRHVELRQWREAGRVLAAAESKFPASLELAELRLKWLATHGDFATYSTRTATYFTRHPHSTTVRNAHLRSLFASGRLAAAESLAQSSLVDPREPSTALSPADAGGFLGLWTLSRCRQGKTLRSRELRSALDARDVDEAVLETFEFWRRCGSSESLLAVDGPADGVEVDLHSLRGGVAHVVQVEVDGTRLERFVVDTGACCTILTEEAARQAGVVRSDGSTGAVMGFTSFAARAGFVHELKIGALTVRNVPVIVGSPHDFGAAGVHGALGVNLMHRVRLTLDYANEKATVARAGQPLPEAATAPRRPWDVPLLTYPLSCVAEGRVGEYPVRVLFDTGNYAAALVTAAWAQNHPDAFNAETRALEGLRVAGVALHPLAVAVTPPKRRELNALFDVCLGYELLRRHRVTIDLQRRVLRLE